MCTRRSKAPRACEKYTHNPTDADLVDADKDAIPPTTLDVVRFLGDPDRNDDDDEDGPGGKGRGAY